jgi:hypothetical protein
MTRHIALAAAALALSAPAFAATGVSANMELDTGVQNIKSTGAKGSYQAGRVEVNFTGRAEGNGGFIAGKASAILSKGGAASTDDAWVQLGTSAFDVKLGRFEAADLYPTPADAARIGGFYQTNALRGRMGDRTHAAATFALGTGLSLELGLVDIKDTGVSGGSKGLRPVLSYAAGPLSLRVGLESGKTQDGADEANFSGAGAALGYALDSSLTLRAAVSSGTAKFAAGDQKRSAALVGVSAGGLNLSVESAKTGDTKYQGAFGGYTFGLFDIKGASMTPSFGTQSTDDGTAKVTNSKFALRVNYTF